MNVSVRANPVLRRELIERWRGWRAFGVVTLYLTVLSGLLYALYRMGLAILTNRFGFGFDPAFAGPSLGRFLLESLLFTVLLLVLFVTPAYAAASIAGERERRTLMLLQLTLLRPVQIVLGKLWASVAWVTLLVVAAVPLGAVLLFLGGVTLPDLLRSVVYLLVVATGVAGIALGISSLVKRTTGAVVLTYGLVLALVGGTLVMAGVEAVLRDRARGLESPPVTLYLNPFYGLADAATTTSGLAGNIDLPAPLSSIAFFLPDADAFVVFGDGPGFAQDDDRSRTPVWLITGGGYLFAGLLGVVVATRRVQSVRSRRGRSGGSDGVVLTNPPPPATDVPPPPTVAAPLGAPDLAAPDLVSAPPGRQAPRPATDVASRPQPAAAPPQSGPPPAPPSEPPPGVAS